jgi:hypothetical protein
MIRILERDRPSTPSWIKEQASIQLKHPWHFSISTKRYPSAGGIPSILMPGVSVGVSVAVAVGIVVAVAAGTGVVVAAGVSVLVGVGVLAGVGLSSGVDSLHPPVPATKMMVPVTFMKSRRVIFVLFSFLQCTEIPPTA